MATATQGRRRRAAGFTLVEMLVVLSVLGLIMTAGFRALGITIRAYETGAAVQDEVEEAVAVANALRVVVENLRPAPDGTVETAQFVAFDGLEDSVRFVGRLPTDTIPGLQDIELAAGGAKGDTVVVRHRLYWPADPDRFEWRETTLARDARLSLAYYGSRSGAIGAQWFETWQRQPALPKRIRIAVTHGDGSVQQTDVAVRITMDPVCFGLDNLPFCRGVAAGN